MGSLQFSILLFTLLSANCAAQLIEEYGFHCSVRDTMKLNRAVHGLPRTDNPPFEMQLLDDGLRKTKFYQPGQNYTLLISGSVHFQGIVLQSRLADKHGFVIGALRGGRFVEDEFWKFYGIRIQACPSDSSNNSITHSNIDKKFLLKIKWTTDAFVGPVQFIATIARDNDVFWERWAPRSGFIMPDPKARANIAAAALSGIKTTKKAAVTSAQLLSEATTEPSVIVEKKLFRQTPKPRPVGVAPEASEPATEPLSVAEPDASVAEPEATPEVLAPNDSIPVHPDSPSFDSSALSDLLDDIKNNPEESNDQVVQEQPEVPLVVFEDRAENQQELFAKRRVDEPEAVTQEPADETSPPAEAFVPVPSENRNSAVPFDLLAGRPFVFIKHGSSHFGKAAAGSNSDKDLLSTLINADGSAGSQSPSSSNSVPAAPQFNGLPPQIPSSVDLSSFSVQAAAPKIVKTTPAAPTTTTTQDPCLSIACQNGGSCEVSPIGYGECKCARGWAGETCSDYDWCQDNDCDHGKCVNDAPNGNYTCECDYDYIGETCERHCPAYLCKHGGTCTVFAGGHYGCICPTGWYGKACDIEVNECTDNPCKNGARCTDLVGKYQCKCTEGWMGKDCDEPCQDFHQSCPEWASNGFCSSKRGHTTFYEENCSASCKRCTYRRDIAPELVLKRFPPELKRLMWLTGVWQTNQSFDNQHYPEDFDRLRTPTFRETINITVSDKVLIGQPVISIKSIAESNTDKFDTKRTQAFLMARNDVYLPGIYPITITSTTNSGLTIIEDGEMSDMTIKLTVSYAEPAYHQGAESAAKLTRELAIDGLFLKQKWERINPDGRITTAVVYYYRVG